MSRNLWLTLPLYAQRVAISRSTLAASLLRLQRSNGLTSTRRSVNSSVKSVSTTRSVGFPPLCSLATGANSLPGAADWPPRCANKCTECPWCVWFREPAPGRRCGRMLWWMHRPVNLPHPHTPAIFLLPCVTVLPLPICPPSPFVAFFRLGLSSHRSALLFYVIVSASLLLFSSLS